MMMMKNTCIFLLPVVSATQQELRHLHRKCGVRFATQIKIQYAHFLINSSKKCTISGIISAMTPRKKHLNSLKIYLKKPAVIENLSKTAAAYNQTRKHPPPTNSLIIELTGIYSVPQGRKYSKNFKSLFAS